MKRAGHRPHARGGGPARSSAQQIAWRDFYGLGESLQRRDSRIALACLDPADLGGVDATAFGHFLLGQASLLARTAKVFAEGAGHAEDSLRWRPTSP